MKHREIQHSLSQARENFLSYFLLSCIGMLIFYTVMELYNHIFWGALADVICLIFVAISFLSLKYHGQRDWQTHVILFGGVALFGPTLVLDSFGDTGIYWLPAMPVLVFMLGGVKKGLLWGAIYFLVLILSMLLAIGGWLELMYSWSEVFFIFIVSSFTGVTSYFFAYFLEQEEAKSLHYQKELKAMSDAKSHFLSVMSHELRTPLHGVIGMQNLLLQDSGEMPKEQRDYVQLSLQALNSLKSLLNDVLDMAKVESGQIETACDIFDVLKCSREALIPLLLTAKQKGLYLRLHVNDVPKKLQGDALHIRQVLLNLVSNAIKFTEQGGIDIYLSYNKGFLNCMVKDSGIGISEQGLKNIFDPFIQGKQGTNHIEGTGLGTAIVKSYVELMGGEISASSSMGEGSCFSFTLPLHAERNDIYQVVLEGDGIAYLDAEIGLEDEVLHEDMRVLLVEDDIISQKVGAKQLKRAGMKVDIASNGSEALGLINKYDYQMVLTDLGMPVMDGISLVKRIRQQELGSSQHLTVIGLSAHAEREMIKRALDVGMDDFLSKPVDMKKALQCMSKVQA